MVHLVRGSGRGRGRGRVRVRGSRVKLRVNPNPEPNLNPKPNLVLVRGARPVGDVRVAGGRAALDEATRHAQHGLVEHVP